MLKNLKSPDLLLKFLFETLAPRGYLIFDVNNPLNIRNYGIKSVISNWIFFYLYPRQKRKEYHWSLDGIRTSVCFSPTKYYTEILKSIGFKDIKVTFLDYNSGAPAFFATGQAVIEAFKP
jgi:hypothetical protein